MILPELPTEYDHEFTRNAYTIEYVERRREELNKHGAEFLKSRSEMLRTTPFGQEPILNEDEVNFYIKEILNTFFVPEVFGLENYAREAEAFLLNALDNEIANNFEHSYVIINQKHKDERTFHPLLGLYVVGQLIKAGLCFAAVQEHLTSALSPAMPIRILMKDTRQPILFYVTSRTTSVCLDDDIYRIKLQIPNESPLLKHTRSSLSLTIELDEYVEQSTQEVIDFLGAGRGPTLFWKRKK